jgi:hypothetical protein
MKYLVLILLIGTLTACAPPYLNPEQGGPVAANEARLSWDQVALPRAEGDAHAALARGDHHLMGTYGYSAGTPGYNADPDGWPHGVIYIEDTTDFARDQSHGAYVRRANAYAQAYNRVVLAAPPTPPQTSPHPRSPG